MITTKYTYMKNYYLLCLISVFSFSSIAQVGVGNTDPKSSLDISASNTATPSNTDGILVPRFDDFPLTDPTADQDGMFAFLTGNGTPEKGFWYWDDNIPAWVRLTSGFVGDADFYEVGTTASPDDINDDQFTMGNTAFGKATANVAVDVFGENVASPGAGFFGQVSSELVVNSNNTTALSPNLNKISFDTGIAGGTFGALQTNFALGSIASNSTQYGTINAFNLTGPVSQIGSINLMFQQSTAKTERMGVFNSIRFDGVGTADSRLRGVYNLFGISGGSFATGNPRTSGSVIGVDNDFAFASNTGAYDKVFGLRNYFTVNSGGFGYDATQYGVYNVMGASSPSNFDVYGLFNSLSGNSGKVYGVYNSIINNTAGGSSDSEIYGSYTSITDGASSLPNYGSFVTISNSATGTGINHGYYASVLGTNNFAGYFLGNVTIGTTDTNTYTLPSSRGADGQIMITDAAGQVNWGDPVEMIDADFFEVGTTSPPDNISDDIYTMGHVAINTPVPTHARLEILMENDMVFGTPENGLYISGAGDFNRRTDSPRSIEIGMAVTEAAESYGILFGSSNTIDNLEYGISSQPSIFGEGQKYAFHTALTGFTGNGEHFGFHNSVDSNSSSEHYGILNQIIGNGDGVQYGVYNKLFIGTGTGTKYGVYNEISNTTGEHYGNYSILNGTGSGDKYGNYTTMPITAGGTHYGVYSDVQKAGSFAGFFLGTVSVTGNINVIGDIITDTATYPDYVFEHYLEGSSEINKKYSFNTLSEVEDFIKQNKHLPGVKGIKELVKTEEGYEINLSEITTQTLEKVEELFLYTIEQEKQLLNVEEKLTSQQQEIDQLKELVKKLVSEK